MNDNTCVVVQCWSGDAHQIHELLPYWQHHEVPVYLQSPEDARVESRWPGVEAMWAGKRGWSGEHTIDRQLKHFQLMLELPYDWFFYTDADAVCLSAEFPRQVYSGEFWSNALSTYDFWTKVHEYKDDDRIGEREEQVREACKYLAVIDEGELDVGKWHSRCPVVMQPPYFFNRGVLEQFIAVAPSTRTAIDFPIPFIDWWYPALCRHSDVVGRGFGYSGISMPTWVPHWLERARNQIMGGGGPWIHSVKDGNSTRLLYEQWRAIERANIDQSFSLEGLHEEVGNFIHLSGDD